MISELIRAAVLLVAFLATPVFLVFAWRGWLRHDHASLRNWQEVLGLSSVAIVSAYWIFLPGWLFIEKHLGGSALVSDFGEAWMDTLIPAMLVAAILSIPLKGRTRLFLFAASVSMTVVFYLSAVE